MVNKLIVKTIQEKGEKIMKAKKYTNGAYNRTTKDREVNDFYATHPKAIEELLKVEKFNQNVWECACGDRKSVV